MKKLTLILIVSLLILPAILFFYNYYQNTNNDTQKTSLSERAKTFRYVQKNQDGNLYESVKYGFKITIPGVFSDQIIDAHYGECLDTIKFCKPNMDTSEIPNRDTPDGFKTAVDDCFFLEIYKNSDSLTPDSNLFNIWHEQIYLGQEIQESKILYVNNNKVLFTHETNGVGGAIGQFYYLFEPGYVFVLWSNDVPAEKLAEIMGSIN